MGDNIDMSLDDIIKKGKTTRGRGRGRGNQRGGRGGRARGNSGPLRRGGRQSNRNQTPYSRPKQLPNKWQHDLFDGDVSSARRLGSGGLVTGCKLHISNLDFGVSDSDIKELFGEFGELKKSTVNFDSSGRSHGTADVIFARRQDALNAVKQYNGVALDGRAMKIEVVSSEVPSQTTTFIDRGRRGNFSNNRSRGGRQGNTYNQSQRGSRGRGRGRGARGRGGQNKGKPVSKDDLDAELEAYIGQEDADMS